MVNTRKQLHTAMQMQQGPDWIYKYNVLINIESKVRAGIQLTTPQLITY